MRLRFQRRALRQIEQALTYIAAESPQGAAKVEARIAAVLRQVRLYPFSGRKTPVPGVRRTYLTPFPYHVDYFVGSDEIVVQRSDIRREDRWGPINHCDGIGLSAGPIDGLARHDQFSVGP